MKALTLTQPWATLVAIGAKKIETRSWSTSYRGSIAIHAAKGFPKWAREFTQEQVCSQAVCFSQWPPLGYPWYPLGFVLATGRLVHCMLTQQVPHLLPTLWTPREREFGDYAPDRYAWILEDIKPFPEPIPAKGALGLWDWNEKL
jgi:activating signal cointegrator 1